MPPPAPTPTPSPFPRVADDPDPFTFTHPTESAAFAASRRLYETTEYNLNYLNRDGVRVGGDNRHALVRSSHAWARGATGAGETVVFADSGFFTGHSEFGGAGKFTLGASFGTPCTTEELRRRLCSDDHGTATAAIAAGRRGNNAPGGLVTTSGVAFDANIIGIRIRLGAGGRTGLNLGPRRLTDADDRSEVEFYERLLYQPVDASLPQADWTYDRNNPWGFVVNFSFGRPHGIDSYTRDDVRENRDRLAALFAQSHRDAADRTIIVWAAGNENGDRYDRDIDGDGELDTCNSPIPGALCPAPSPGAERFREEGEAGDPIDATSPTLNPALGVYFPELQSHMLAVAAVDQQGVIADFSNRCGTAKGFCLAAPGATMWVARRGDCSVSSLGDLSCESRFQVRGGTSYAAPMVTGALAVMRQFFRNPPGSPDAGEPALGNTELVTRLLATADRSDRSATGGPDYSDSDKYGHGLVDLDAATRPVGMLMASTSDGRRVAADATALDLGRAADGGAVARRLRAAPVALFDALDAPFFTTADKLVSAPATGAGAAAWAAADAAAAAAATQLRAGAGDRQWWFAPKYNSGAGLGFANFSAGDALRHRHPGPRIAPPRHPRALPRHPRALPRHPRSLLSGGPADFGAGFTGDRDRAGFTGPGARARGHGFDGDAGLTGPAAAFLAPHPFAAPYFALVRHGFGGGFSAGVGAGGRLGFALMRGAPAAGFGGGDAPPGHAFALSFAPRPLAGGALNLQAGVVQEGEGFLGVRGSGAFGEARGETLFAGAGLAWRIGRWRAQAAAFAGQTRADADPGLLRGVSGLRSAAFSLALARASALARGDWFGVRVGQPLRVEAGRAKLRLATGRSRYGEVRFSDLEVALKPRARELQIEAAWRAPPELLSRIGRNLGGVFGRAGDAHGGDLSLGLQLTRHPGHNPDADARAFVWLRFGREF